MLSHTYDQFLATLHHYRGKNWKSELNKLLLMKVFDRDRNVKIKMIGCVEVTVSPSVSSIIASSHILCQQYTDEQVSLSSLAVVVNSFAPFVS